MVEFLRRKNKIVHSRWHAGFTVGEMVIVIAVIAILAALIAPLAVNVITQNRINACIDELEIIKKAIVGDPSLVEGGTRSSFGFVGDMGILPRDNLGALGLGQDNTLADLVYQNGLQGSPGAGAILWGWRGPYINEYRDAWGRDYFYINYWPGGNPAFQNLPSIIARIWSAGPDGQTDTDPLSSDTRNDDNILIEIRTDEAFSMISGNMLDEDGVNVQFQRIILTYPDGGAVLRQDTIIPAVNQVVYNFTNPIPIGVRQIYFEAEVGDTTTLTQYIAVNNGPNTSKNLRDPYN